jgi:F-type H+-transporting ATPase subunit g
VCCIAYRAPITYNLSVARELLKHIYVAERLQPPTVAELKTAYSMVLQRLSSPAAIREIFSSGQGLRIGIYAAEAYGIFSVRSCF